jgi:hypothetical protein
VPVDDKAEVGRDRVGTDTGFHSSGRDPGVQAIYKDLHSEAIFSRGCVPTWAGRRAQRRRHARAYDG